MHPTWQHLVANLITSGDWVQAAHPFLLQLCLAAMTCCDLRGHKLAVSAWPRVANILTIMIATWQMVATNIAA